MPRKARTPIVEYNDRFVIEIPGETPPTDTDRLTDQRIVVGYGRLPGRHPRWQLRELSFDRDAWTRSGIRMWWAAHEVIFLSADQLDREIPEVCRAYAAPSPNLPTIVLCHRNTPPAPARQQMEVLRQGKKAPAQHK